MEESAEYDARVIAVGNQKGGVGKTTISVHLATALAEIGRRCLIWDLDMNCGATRHFGIPADMPVLGTFEVFKGDEDPLDVVVANGDIEGIDLPDRVHLIPARRNLEGIDASLAAQDKYKFDNPKDILRPLIQGLRPVYDYIFLDTAPNLTTPTMAAYKAADYFLLSAFPESFAIDGLRAALEDIATVRGHGNPALRLIGIVLSAVDGRTSRLKRELMAYVQETFDRGDPYMQSYTTTITRTTYISGSQKIGKTMFQTYPTHKVTDQYRALAREVEQRLNAIEQRQPDQPGRLARLKEVAHG
jgi:chromosome partitioning protein